MGCSRTFKSAFVYTGLMKPYNAFGATGSSGVGYEIVSANGGNSFTVNVLGLEGEDCNLLAAQDWAGSTLVPCSN